MVLMLRLLLSVQVPVLPEQIPTVKGIFEQIRMSGENGKQKVKVYVTDALSGKETGGGSDAKKDSSLQSANVPSGAALFIRTVRNVNPFVLLWLCGVILSAVFFLYRMRKECNVYRQALPAGTKEFVRNGHTLQIPVYYSDQITSPAAFGILRGRIVIPTSMFTGVKEGREYILLHECMHICHRDNLKKTLAALCVCIHWFSPLVWIWIIVFYRDLELACDEAVLASLGKQAREPYALTLIAFMEQNQKWSTINSGFGQTAIKERIVSIMNYRKKGLCSIAVSAALIGSSLTVFAENKPAPVAVKEDNSEDELHNSEDDLYDSEAVELDFAEYYTLPEEVAESAHYSEYEKQGLSYDEEKQMLLYKGKKVVFLEDFISVSDNKVLCYEDQDYFAFTEEETEDDSYTNAEETESNSDAEYNSETESNTEDDIIYLFAVRDSDGKLTGFQIPEVSQGDLVSENADTDNGQQETETDLVETAIIGGADGLTSIFLAGKFKK